MPHIADTREQLPPVYNIYRNVDLCVIGFKNEHCFLVKKAQVGGSNVGK